MLEARLIFKDVESGSEMEVVGPKVSDEVKERREKIAAKKKEIDNKWQLADVGSVKKKLVGLTQRTDIPSNLRAEADADINKLDQLYLDNVHNNSERYDKLEGFLANMDLVDDRLTKYMDAWRRQKDVVSAYETSLDSFYALSTADNTADVVQSYFEFKFKDKVAEMDGKTVSSDQLTAKWTAGSQAELDANIAQIDSEIPALTFLTDRYKEYAGFVNGGAPEELAKMIERVNGVENDINYLHTKSDSMVSVANQIEPLVWKELVASEPRLTNLRGSDAEYLYIHNDLGCPKNISNLLSSIKDGSYQSVVTEVLAKVDAAQSGANEDEAKLNNATLAGKVLSNFDKEFNDELVARGLAGKEGVDNIDDAQMSAYKANVAKNLVAAALNGGNEQVLMESIRIDVTNIISDRSGKLKFSDVMEEQIEPFAQNVETPYWVVNDVMGEYVKEVNDVSADGLTATSFVKNDGNDELDFVIKDSDGKAIGKGRVRSTPTQSDGWYMQIDAGEYSKKVRLAEGNPYIVDNIREELKNIAAEQKSESENR